MSSSVQTRKMEEALRDFIRTINATGGLAVNDAGETIPVADEDWLDLAEAYLLACDALGVKPLLGEE